MLNNADSRIMRFAFLLLAFSFLCSCLLDESLQIRAIQKNAAYKDTVLLGDSGEILGYDPETLELKIRISTNTLIAQKIAVLEGDRAVFGDIGPRLGIVGKSLGVLGPSGSLDQIVDALPHPSKVVVDDSWLFVDSVAWDFSGNARFSLYRTSDMRKIKEFTGFPFSTANDGAWIIDGVAYI